MKLKSTRRASIASRRKHELKSNALTIDSPDVRPEKILIPIDFSELSHKALRYANALALQFRAELFLLHVVEPLPILTTEFGITPTTTSDTRLLEKEATRRLAEWRKEIDSSLRVLTTVRTGESAREIVTATSESECDLIVIGTHGRTGLDRMLMGNTAERVVRFAPCPVLVVRERERDFIRPVTTRERSRGLKAHRGKARRQQ